jgi:hypothetical protein
MEMRIVRFNYERENDDKYIFSDLDSFYLWEKDIHIILKSIVPLAQHLFWLNGKTCMEPKAEPDFTDLLTTNTMSIEFEEMPRLKAPEIMSKGMWWERPDGTNFFVPMSKDGMMSRRVMDHITHDLDEAGVASEKYVRDL